METAARPAVARTGPATAAPRTTRCPRPAGRTRPARSAGRSPYRGAGSGSSGTARPPRASGGRSGPGLRRRSRSAAAASRGWGSTRPSDHRTRPGTSAAPSRRVPRSGSRHRSSPFAALPARSEARSEHETQPVVGPLQGRLGHRAGAFGPGGQDGVQLRLVLQVAERLLPERGDELDHDLGEVLLEVAVPATGILVLELADLASGQG